MPQAVNQGNRVVFQEEGSYIENKQTGVQARLTNKLGTCHYVVWVKKSKEKDNGKKDGSPEEALCRAPAVDAGADGGVPSVASGRPAG